jgi:predicted dehydrogenase
MRHSIRIGLIGLGDVAQAHWQAYREEPWISVVSACDIRPEAVNAFCQESGALGFSNVDSLLDHGGIDLALVLTPAAMHRRVTERVASAGIHVFCEKPMALRREDAQAMLDACDAAGVHFFYGSCYRYLPAIRKARDLVTSGAIGTVKLLREQIVGGFGPQNYDEYGPDHYPTGGPGGPGSGLVDHGIHLIDVMPWISGSNIINVGGSGVISGAGPGVEYMVMHMGNGAEGHLLYYSASWFTDLPSEAHISQGIGWAADGSWIAAGELDPHPGSISVYGDKGSLRILHYDNALYLFNSEGSSQVALSGRAAPGHFASQLEDCAQAVFENDRPLVNGHDGLRALDVLLRSYGL